MMSTRDLGLKTLLMICSAAAMVTPGEETDCSELVLDIIVGDNSTKELFVEDEFMLARLLGYIDPILSLLGLVNVSFENVEASDLLLCLTSVYDDAG